jgi:hypothetical protein
VFCRKSEAPEVTRQRHRRASKEEAFGGPKTENVSQRYHARHVSEAAAYSHLIGG